MAAAEAVPWRLPLALSVTQRLPLPCAQDLGKQGGGGWRAWKGRRVGTSRRGKCSVPGWETRWRRGTLL